jgi:cytoskeletal protein CcmA (bactofilin family)
MATISRRVQIRGELSSDEDLVIEGSVRGLIQSRAGLLTIGPEATIEADVQGHRVDVHGRLTGNVAATERIELHPSAQVLGTLSANHVVLNDGARFNGRIDMDRRTIAATVARHRAEQA